MQYLAHEYNLTTQSRSFCPDCEFLKTRCLCDTLKNIPNKLHLIILQHPNEVKHPLNTVRIMKKSFQSMTVILGEDFTNDDLLNSILNEGKNNCAILYPNENAISLEQNSPINALTHLILIDGTWRKAKRIFTLSKNLHSLPSFKLLPENNSDYRIRKAPNKESLSTLEATVYALQILEPNLNTKTAVTTFDKMIDFQIKKMGREVFQKNYLDKKQ